MKIKRNFPDIEFAELKTIETNFHDVIMGRARKLVEEQSLKLPDLTPLLEKPLRHKEWFPIPGMYGGFSYWLTSGKFGTRLVTESWCRVVDGSWQRHLVTSSGSRLTKDDTHEAFLRFKQGFENAENKI